MTEQQMMPKRTLTRWLPIPTGQCTRDELATRVWRVCDEVSDNADILMVQMTVALNPGTVDLVRLTLVDLGLTSNRCTDAFMTKEFCAKWSAENLEGAVIELCEAEDGPQLCVQYPGEHAVIAMEPIAGLEDKPSVFMIHLGSLMTPRDTLVSSEEEWHLDTRFVFRLRKLPGFSAIKKAPGRGTF